MIWALYLPSFLWPVVLDIYIRKPEIPVVLVNQMFRAIPIGKLQSYREDITRWREDMNVIFDWQNNILRTGAGSE